MKKPNLTKRMHFVPQSYLRVFGFLHKKEHHIYFLSKEDVFGEINHISTANICVETGLYSLAGLKGIHEQFCEVFYRDQHDKGYNLLHRWLTKPNRTCAIPEGSYAAVGFVISTLLRNPTWQDRILDFIGGTYEQCYNLATANGKNGFMIGEKMVLFEGKPLETFLKDMRSRDRKIFSMTVVDMGIKLGRARWVSDYLSITRLDLENEFITSDNPVIQTPNFLPMADPINMFSIPVDSKHLLLLRGVENGENPEVLHQFGISAHEEAEYTWERNIAQLENCTRFVMGSKKALEAFQSELKTRNYKSKRTNR